MKGIDTLKEWIGALTELALMLLALAIVLSLLVGANLPFFGAVTANIMAWVKDMGANGLVGLITLGIVLWLFSNRKMALTKRAFSLDGIADAIGVGSNAPHLLVVRVIKRFRHAQIHGQHGLCERASVGARRTRLRQHSRDHADLSDPRTRLRGLCAVGR